jgi:transposase-like protein
MQRFVPVEALFKGRHFDRQIIILCVSWYTSFKLSLRDLVMMMADRGITLTHTTILRWVQHYLPEFEKRWNRYARPVGGSWRMDETYIKVRGNWVYLYRAVDKAGRTVDFFLSRNRDVTAAKTFLRNAMKNRRTPTKITLDAYAASHRAVREMKETGELPRQVKVRSSRYLNNLVEQDLSFAKNASAGIALRCRAFVTVMQAAEVRNLDDRSGTRDVPNMRTLLVES